MAASADGSGSPIEGGLRSLEIIVEPDAGGVARAAAAVVQREASMAIRDGRGFDLALSGGSTPAGLYRLLGGDGGAGIPWPRVRLFWGDERCVPPSNELSNYRMAALTGLLDRPVEAVHRMQGELPPDEGARAYELVLRNATSQPVPVFDLVLLGLGDDGHTASLFPGSPALDDRTRLVVPTEPVSGVRRLTVTLPVLWAARRLLFLVSGDAKAPAVARVLQSKDEELPATQAVSGARLVTWIVDTQAANGLSLS